MQQCLIINLYAVIYAIKIQTKIQHKDQFKKKQTINLRDAFSYE